MIQGYKVTQDAARKWVTYHRGLTKDELREKWDAYTSAAEPVVPIQQFPDDVQHFRTFGYVFETHKESITAVHPWRPHHYTSIVDV